MSTTKPVFILGVGAQKAGTTFLNNALQEHPDVAMSVPKELHIFDSYFLPETCHYHESKRREALIEMLATPPSALTPKDKRRVITHLRLCTMQYDLLDYVRYFRDLMRKKKVRYVGDITPEYQLLEAEHFRSIRKLLEPHFDVRVVFLMRDPIDRVFSAMRMIDRNDNRTENLAHERFEKGFKAGQLPRNSQYEHTIAALDAAFDKHQVYYEFYENMFQTEAFDRIGKFLGLEGLTADFDEKVNSSPTQGKPGKEAIATARHYFAPTYDFCMERFGEGHIRELWKNC